jgi:hypothetical protein
MKWREANPEKVDTEEDDFRGASRGIERLLAEAGVAEEDMAVKAKMLARGLLMVKRK